MQSLKALRENLSFDSDDPKVFDEGLENADILKFRFITTPTSIDPSLNKEAMHKREQIEEESL